MSIQTITAGYTAFNGYEFNAATAAAYNRMCDRTERASALAGDKPSPQAAQGVEQARDSQARMFKDIIGVS